MNGSTTRLYKHAELQNTANSDAIVIIQEHHLSMKQYDSNNEVSEKKRMFCDKKKFPCRIHLSRERRDPYRFINASSTDLNDYGQACKVPFSFNLHRSSLSSPGANYMLGKNFSPLLGHLWPLGALVSYHLSMQYFLRSERNLSELKKVKCDTSTTGIHTATGKNRRA